MKMRTAEVWMRAWCAAIAATAVMVKESAGDGGEQDGIEFHPELATKLADKCVEDYVVRYPDAAREDELDSTSGRPPSAEEIALAAAASGGANDDGLPPEPARRYL
jgi:hypothetical protein